MKQYLSVCLFAALAILSGCYKDKGNYDLHEINQLSFKTTSPDTLRVKLFSRLAVNMDVEQSQSADAANLEYSWRLFTWPNAGAVIPLGKTKNLDTAVTFNPGVYKLVFDAKDKISGIVSFKEFIVDISSDLSEGWLLLEDLGGVQDLSLVTGLKDIYRDIYLKGNGERLPSGSQQVRIINTFSNPQEIVVFGNNNGLRMSYINFQRQFNYADLFFTAPAEIAPEEVYANKLGVSGFIVNKGKLHSVDYAYQGEKKYGAAKEGNWVISPQVLPMFASDNTMLFDTRNQRFLKHTNDKIQTLASVEGSQFELDNVGKQLIYAGRSLSDHFNCLMKNNNDDSLFIYRLNPEGTLIATDVFDVLDAPGMGQASHYASSELYMHMYYSIGNKIYLLDIPAQKARLLYTFPAGETISAMRLKQAQGLILYWPDNNRVMSVATWNGTKGKFYKFSIANTGDFSGGTYDEAYGGFGKILDLYYKWKQ
ncbi:PKD-like family lipoprotein [Chitinophaga sp.]|uniref:PKD-like family lipoprotein n=1 Tax=Chitinophaga sp. TaxID=1869181 RepID=UPI002FDD22A5